MYASLSRSWQRFACAVVAASCVLPFAILLHAGSLSSVAPSGASAGVTISITGIGFDPAAGNNDVTFTPAGGAPVTVSGLSIATVDVSTGARRLAATVPAGLPIGATALRVTNKTTGEKSEGQTLQVIALDLPETTSAARGSSGVRVRVRGSSNTHFAATNIRVSFGAGITVQSTSVESPTSLVATIAVAASAALGSRTVTVISTETGQIANGFTIADTPPPPTNRAPVVAAGPNQSITLPGGAALQGTVTDDGLPAGGALTSRWTMFSGPGTATFADPFSASTTASFDQAGTYVLRLTGNDSALSSAADVAITVSQAAANVQVSGYDGVYDAHGHGATGTATGASGENLTALLHLGSSFTDVPGGTAHWVFDGNAIYKPASGDVQIAITQAEASIHVDGFSGLYDGNTHGATGTATGVAAENLTSLLHLGNTFTDVPGGVAQWTFDGNTNYKQASGSAPIVLAQANATIVVNGYSGLFDGNAHGATGSATGVKGESLANLLHLGNTFTDAPGGIAHWIFDGNANYRTASGDVAITISTSAPVNRAPVAVISGGPASGLTGESIAFDGSSSSDPDGDALTFAWRFGDGATASGPKPNHAYAIGDQFTITLTVTDGRGGSNSATSVATIVQANRPPSGSAGGRYTGDLGSTIAFNGTGSDPDGDPLAFAWDFGDGSTAIGRTPTHTYGQQGTFPVTLTVTDGRGGVATDTTDASVGPAVDRISPAVQLNAPATALPGTHPVVVADAVDNVSVAGVTFDVSSAPSSDAVTAPYQRTVDVPPLASPGSKIKVKATARDAAGNSGSAEAEIRIVAAPDTTPPSVTIQLPPQASPGSVVFISALASDDVGVRVVEFSTAGVPFGTTGSSPYSVKFTVPAGTAPGSTLTFVAKALDFASNSAESSGQLPIVAAPDTVPPTLTLAAPESVLEGDVLHISATAADDVKVAEVDFLVDDVVVGRSITQPYRVDVRVTRPAGSVLRVHALAKDSTGNEASGDAQTRVIAPPSGGPAVVAGQVFDNTTGLPLGGATIGLTGTDANGLPYSATATSDERGQYLLDVSGGEGTLQIARAGWTRVERPITILENVANVAVDARLTPLAAPQTVPAVLGGSVTTGDAALAVFPGAVANDAAFQLTVVDGQGLEGLLRLGWSPVGAIDLAPHGIAFTSPQSISLTNRFKVPAGTQLVLALWDEAAGDWRAATTVVVDDASRLTGALPSSGQWAWLLADVTPAAPPFPTNGSLIAGVDRTVVPDPATVDVTPKPRVLFYEPGVSSIVNATLKATLPSGTLLRSRITESYDFKSGAELRLDPMHQDLVFYQQPALAVGLAATFVVTPSSTFDSEDFRQGVIGVELDVPDSQPLPVVGSGGGSVSATTGESLQVPAGAFPNQVPVALEHSSADEIGVALPPSLALIGAVTVGFSGAVPTLPTALSIPKPPDVDGSTPILVLKIVDFDGATRLLLAGGGRVVGTRIVSEPVIAGTSAQLTGVNGPGRYAMVRGTVGIGFVTGTVAGSGGNPFPGALIGSAELPVVALSDGGGKYVIPAVVGPVNVNARDLRTLDSASGAAVVPGVGGLATLDLRLSTFVLTLTSLTPGDGTNSVALSAAVVATFSSPLDASSVTGGTGSSSALFVTAPDGSLIPGSLVLTNGNTKLTFRPATLLAPDTQYTAVVSTAVRDTSGHPLSAAATTRFTTLNTAAPPFPPAGNIVATIPDANGFTTVTATQGSAGAHDAVSIVNLTKRTSFPALVDASGGFSATFAVSAGDKLQIAITSPAGAQTVVPLPPFTRTNGDGSLAMVVGSEGGRVLGPAGIAVDIPVDTVPDGTVVTIQSIDEASFPVQLNQEQRQYFSFRAGLHLDFGGATPSQYVNVSVPTQGGEPRDKRWIVAAAAIDDPSGLNVVDTARVIEGRITTSSPPCPGINGGASYAFLESNASLSAGYGRMVDPSLGMSVSINGGSPLYSTTTAPTPNQCFPFLTRRVSVLPNTQKVVLAASNFTPLDREIVVHNNALNQDFHYPRNVAEYRFLVPGRSTDTFKVSIESNGAEQPVTAFDVDAAAAGFVNIRLDISSLNVSVSSVIVRNQTPGPGVTPLSTFPQSTAAVLLPVPGGRGDTFAVQVVNASGVSRAVVPNSVLSPNGDGNLIARAILGTVDDSRPANAFIDKVDPANHAQILQTIPIPPDKIVDGGFQFSFDGAFANEDYQIRIEYPAATVHDAAGHAIDLPERGDAFVVPRVVITVSEKATGRVVNTIAMPVPPPDDPFFPLGNISGDRTPPSLTTLPAGLRTFDTSDLLTFTFSEGIDRTSALNGVTVLDGSGKAVAGDVRVTNGNKTITFVPAAPLHLATNYSINFKSVADGAGNRMADTSVFVTTVTPNRSAAIGAAPLEQVESMTIVKKGVGSSGLTKTLGFAVTRDPIGGHAVAILDLTIPSHPLKLGAIPMSDGGRVTVVPDVANLVTQGVNPCGGSHRYTGDLLILSNFDVGLGSAVRYFDVTDPANPCPVNDVLGAKLLTITPANLGTIGSGPTITPDGVVPAWNGFARGVAALRNGAKVTSYIAVQNVGLMMVDVGDHIPPVTADKRTLEPFAEGNYVDVVAANGRLLAVERSHASLDIFDANLALLSSTASTTGLSLREAIAVAYADGVPFDLNGDSEVGQDEIRNLAFVGGAGGVAIVDVTDLTSPQQVGFVPMEGVIYQVAFDADRRRIFASGTVSGTSGDFGVFAIDLSGVNPFGEIDVDGDGADDRIVFSATSSSPTATLYRALQFDADTRTLYAGTVAGFDVYQLDPPNLTGIATYTYIHPKPVSFGRPALDYANAAERPIRGAIVELRNSAGTVLKSAITGEDGSYALYAPVGATVEVVVKAAGGIRSTETIRVVDNCTAAICASEGPNASKDPDGLYKKSSGPFVMPRTKQQKLFAQTIYDSAGFSYVKREAAPFAILDTVFTAEKAVTDVDPALSFRLLTLGWSPLNQPNKTGGFHPESGLVTWKFYNSNLKTLFLLGQQNVDTDEYDTQVILHEWCHYFQDSFGRDDSVGGDHGGFDILDPRVAFSEGFATAFAAMFTNDILYMDTNGVGQGAGFVINIDRDSTLTTGAAAPSGHFAENSVQQLLWDLYDPVKSELDAESGTTIEDKVELKLGPIYRAVRAMKDSPATTTIYSFLNRLLAQDADSAPFTDSDSCTQATIAVHDLALRNNIIALATAENIDLQNANEYEQCTTINVTLLDGVTTLKEGPLFTTLPTNGTTVLRFGPGLPRAAEFLETDITFDAIGAGNKLGNHVFFRFKALASANFEVTVTPTYPAGVTPTTAAFLTVNQKGTTWTANGAAGAALTYAGAVNAAGVLTRPLHLEPGWCVADVALAQLVDGKWLPVNGTFTISVRQK